MPPMRKVRPCGASLAATCEGVKKNTRFFWNADSTSAAAMPSAATPTAIAASRLCLGFTASPPQDIDLEGEAGDGRRVGPPHVEALAAHRPELAPAAPVHSRSRMMQRTRVRDAAMLYSQNASAMSSMPASMVLAMLGARVRLTDAPWCSVFHHCTE